jgi:hypothetical protein
MPLSSPPSPYTVQFDSSGVTQVFPNGISTVILDPAAPVAALQYVTPTKPANGQTIDLCTTQTITTLVMAASANQTVLDAFTAQLSAGQGLRYRFNAFLATWFRIL